MWWIEQFFKWLNTLTPYLIGVIIGGVVCVLLMKGCGNEVYDKEEVKRLQEQYDKSEEDIIRLESSIRQRHIKERQLEDSLADSRRLLATMDVELERKTNAVNTLKGRLSTIRQGVNITSLSDTAHSIIITQDSVILFQDSVIYKQDQMITEFERKELLNENLVRSLKEDKEDQRQIINSKDEQIAALQGINEQYEDRIKQLKAQRIWIVVGGVGSVILAILLL